MADDKNNPEDHLDTPGDSGLGNLPPLSDFDSGGMDSDGGLPPLGNFDSGGSPSDSAGLPPISDIQVETPQPTGGNVRPRPAGFDSQVSDTFSSGTPGIDTPAGTTPSEGVSPVGSGFQDLAADSDFSPETPEIGPGPDSNMDTPMFDSAFGGGSGGGFGSSRDTGAPTQAMETPMFGKQSRPDQRGFDAGAFGGSGGDFGGGGGTPAPDFSPDTDMRAPRGMQPMSEPAGRGGGGSPMALVIAAVIALIVGVVAGPYLSQFVPIPNPLNGQVAELTSRADSLQVQKDQIQAKYDALAKTGGPGDVVMTPAAREELEKAIIELRQQKQEADAEYSSASEKLTKAQSDLDSTTEQFVARREEYEDLTNELSISQAQQRGLVIEVDRLTNQVGQLQEADDRRAATKQSLEHAVDRLYIQIKEGIPLTPAKYDRNARIAKVEALRDQVGGAKWVTPALQDAYTDLYLDELAIAQSEEYFYSRIPVIDSYGTRVHKLAECVMSGNHEVLYRTFDGKNIGVFKNLGTDESPAWGFTEEFPPAAKKEIEARIMNSRVPGFEEKVQALAERQLSMEDETSFQKAFSSL